ncbi:hypothetical protein U9M48_041485 [Paspalum notatum var. saurae]|uniref:Uncharacterized protein n=1 Tax=Paspalum notatum var. saurae TaxID=547442 RepID=A0AAQ3UPB3_PASNO
MLGSAPPPARWADGGPRLRSPRARQRRLVPLPSRSGPRLCAAPLRRGGGARLRFHSRVAAALGSVPLPHGGQQRRSTASLPGRGQKRRSAASCPTSSWHPRRHVTPPRSASPVPCLLCVCGAFSALPSFNRLASPLPSPQPRWQRPDPPPAEARGADQPRHPPLVLFVARFPSLLCLSSVASQRSVR